MKTHQGPVLFCSFSLEHGNSGKRVFWVEGSNPNFGTCCINTQRPQGFSQGDDETVYWYVCGKHAQ